MTKYQTRRPDQQPKPGRSIGPALRVSCNLCPLVSYGLKIFSQLVFTSNNDQRPNSMPWRTIKAGTNYFSKSQSVYNMKKGKVEHHIDWRQVHSYVTNLPSDDN